MKTRRVVTVTSAASLLLVGIAHATSLGGLAAGSLLAIDPAGTVTTPSTIGCDNFTGTTGATMAGRTATVAGSCASRVWTVHVGTWTIQSNKAASSATASAVATQNSATVNSTDTVVLTSLNTLGRSGGLVLSHDGASTYLAAVMIDGSPDRVELRLVVSGTATVLATVNPTFATTNTLQFARSNSTVTVTLNGGSIINATLTAAQITSLGAGARAGLFGGDSGVRFDDFLVTSP